MAAALSQSVLDGMLTAFVVNEGVIKLVSPDDDGRSLVCAALFEALRRQGTEVVYFLAPPQSVQALQDGIVEQLQLDSTRNFTRTLTHYLNSRDHTYRHLVLIMDHAHAMDEPTLLAVRMLCNIQSHAHELVRVVLSGSPALDTLLGLPPYRSLAQHIGQSFTLAPAASRPLQQQETEPQTTPPLTGQADAPAPEADAPSSRGPLLLGIVPGLVVLGAMAWLVWPQSPLSSPRTAAVLEAPAPLATAVSQPVATPLQVAATPMDALAVEAIAVAAIPLEAEPPQQEPAPEPANTAPPLPSELEDTLSSWLTSWQRRALDDYLEYYAAQFMPPPPQSRNQWQQQRIHNISSAGGIELTYSGLSWTLPTPDRATLRFWLHYRSNDYDDDTLKELALVRQPMGEWRIVRELNLEVKRLP